MANPLDEIFAVNERGHPPPTRVPPCPACRQSLHFSHYAAERATLGALVGTRFYVVEILACTLLIATTMLVAIAFGVLAMALFLLVAGPLAYLLISRQIENTAVWHCSACDRNFFGPRLRPWKAGRVE